MRPLRAAGRALEVACAACEKQILIYASRLEFVKEPCCSRACTGMRKTQIAAQRTMERFWGHVDKTNDCWIWRGKTNKSGYGQFFTGSVTTGDRKHVMAHRMSWEMKNGPIPEGAYILHSCDNPPCVRPDHLRPGSALDNIRDMIIRGRQRPHDWPDKCKNGHVRTEANTATVRGARFCRVCRAAMARRYRLKRSMGKARERCVYDDEGAE